MTGKHLHRVGAYDNGAPFPSDQATWAHMLRAAGYEVVLDGKMHFIGPDTLHGFERQLARDSRGGSPARSGSTRSPGFRDGATTRRWVEEAGPGKRNNLSSTTRWRRRRWPSWAKGREADAAPWALCVELPGAPLPAGRPRAVLRHVLPAQRRPAGDPAGPPRGAAPGPRAGPAGVRPLRLHRGADPALPGRVLRAGDAPGRAHRAAAGGAGRGGLREDTVVVYTSDHGEFIGEHGLWWKNDFYEHSSRVPLIVSWPGRVAAGARFGGAVSLLDLTRTLVDLAGAPEPGDLDGDSLVPVLRDPAGPPGRTRPSASTTGTPPTGRSACCAAGAGSCATTTASRWSCSTCSPIPAS